MSKALRALGLAALAAIIPFNTASSALASTTPKTGNLESLGTASPNEGISAGLTVEAHKAERNDSGNLTSVTWSIENSKDEPVNISWLAGNSYMYDGPFFSGATAINPEGTTRFHPIMDGMGTCLCSGMVNSDFKERLNPGDKVAYWSMYSIPDDIDVINLEIPGFEVIEDIPVS